MKIFKNNNNNLGGFPPAQPPSLPPPSPVQPESCNIFLPDVSNFELNNQNLNVENDNNIQRPATEPREDILRQIDNVLDEQEMVKPQKKKKKRNEIFLFLKKLLKF